MFTVAKITYPRHRKMTMQYFNWFIPVLSSFCLSRSSISICNTFLVFFSYLKELSFFSCKTELLYKDFYTEFTSA